MLATFHFANAVKAASLALAVALSVTTAARAVEYERWIEIQNYGSNEIIDIRITHVCEDSWGYNLLIDDYIGAGEDRFVEPLYYYEGDCLLDYDEEDCLFDVLIEYADQSEVALWEVNLCKAPSVAVDEWDYEIGYL